MASLWHMKIVISVLSVVYLIFSVATFYYAWLATVTDSSDPTLALEKECAELKYDFDPSNYEFHCKICNSHVLAGSKHCGQCNKCSSGFDHHCRYLNNCIGEANYDYFFKLIIWVFWMLLLHCVASGIVIADVARAQPHVDQNHSQLYGTKGIASGFQIGLIVLAVFNLLGMLFLANLIVFHIELKYKGLTTYEYLKMQENTLNKPSKIVVRIQQEARQGVEDEIQAREKLRIEQEELRKKLNKLALDINPSPIPADKNEIDLSASSKENKGLLKDDNTLEDSIQKDKNEFDKTASNIMGKSGEEDTDSMRDSATILKRNEQEEDQGPSCLLVLSKFFSCLPCCHSRSAQVLQDEALAGKIDQAGQETERQ